MKVGLCTSPENATLARDAGFDYIEGNVQGLLVAEQSDEFFAGHLKAARGAVLPITAANCFLPGTLKCVGPDVDEDRLVRYAETAFRRAQEAGIRLIVFGSGGARQIPEGFSRDEAHDEMLAFLCRIVPLAQAHGVVLVLESLNSQECNFINSLAEGAAFVTEIDHPHFRLLVDIYHMLMEGEAPGEIVKYGAWIQHAHVAELNGRFAPGTSGEDFGPYLRALKKIDYRGTISFECNWKRQLSEEGASSVRSFREQLQRAGLE